MAHLSAKEHLPVLDGVRGIAVLMVVCLHFWQIFDGNVSLVGKLAAWGQTGVDLFFVLSGFLITGILLDSRGGARSLRNFYVRRVLRIFPLYYLALIGFYLVAPAVGLLKWAPLRDSWWFWTYLQDVQMTFFPSEVPCPTHFWSLAIEEHYYLAWPFAVVWLERRLLLGVILAAIGVSLVTRLVLIHGGYGVSYFTLCRLDGLAIGSALAIFAREKNGLQPWVARARLVLLIGGVLLAGSQLVLGGKGLPLLQVTKSTLIALLCASFVLLAVQDALGSLASRLLSSAALGSVGKYSYAMYVVHPYALLFLRRLGVSFSLPGLVAGIALTYFLAWISWVAFEQHFLRLKQRFAYEV